MQVLPNLLLGESSKVTREVLQEHKVTCVHQALIARKVDIHLNVCRHVLSLSSPPFQLPGAGDVEWLVVDLQDRRETEIFHLFPTCNAFMLNSNKPERVVLVAGVFGGGNASSAVLTAFVMAANKESYSVASECVYRAAPKAMPHAQHFVEQLELSGALHCSLDPFAARARQLTLCREQVRIARQHDGRPQVASWRAICFVFEDFVLFLIASFFRPHGNASMLQVKSANSLCIMTPSCIFSQHSDPKQLAYAKWIATGKKVASDRIRMPLRFAALVG